jgi:hypothetical protein
VGNAIGNFSLGSHELIQAITNQVARSAAQNAASQLTRLAFSGGKIGFNKNEFYSSIASAAASATLDYHLGLSSNITQSNGKAKKVASNVLSIVSYQAISAAINHQDLKMDRLISSVISEAVITASNYDRIVNKVQAGIAQRQEAEAVNTKRVRQNKIKPNKKSVTQIIEGAQCQPGMDPSIEMSYQDVTQNFSIEESEKHLLQDAPHSSLEYAKQQAFMHDVFYSDADVESPPIKIGTLKQKDVIHLNTPLQREYNPGAANHLPGSSNPLAYADWHQHEPSKWQRFEDDFWSGIDATNRSYEHTMGSLVAPVRGLKYLYDHPDAITKGINYVSSHPGEVVASIGNSLERTATKFANGDTFTKYEMLLNGFSDTVTGTFTGGAAAKATTTAAAAGTKLVGATLTHTKSAGLLLAGIVKTGEKVPNRGASSFVLHEAALEIKKLPSPRDFMLHNVENPKLRKMINFLYRDRAKVGNGGTADILRKEFLTGELYSPKGHLQKAIEARKSIKRIINSNTLNERELQIAHQMRQELHEAISHESWDKMYPNRLEMRR